MSMTLAEVRDAIADRGLIALNLHSKSSGGWQASARSAGVDGWVVAQGDTIEEAVRSLFMHGSCEARWVAAIQHERLLAIDADIADLL